MELKELVERVGDIRHAQPTKYVRERVQEAAQALSRAGDMQLRVELANEALMALTAILYDSDSDGKPANIDPVTWRLLIPAPWGRAGWRRWGLRAWEADTLRAVLRVRSEMRRHTNLFDYNDPMRSWHVNVTDYPTVTAALTYLKTQPITLAEWRQHADIQNRAARARMQRSRDNRR